MKNYFLYFLLYLKMQKYNKRKSLSRDRHFHLFSVFLESEYGFFESVYRGSGTVERFLGEDIANSESVVEQTALPFYFHESDFAFGNESGIGQAVVPHLEGVQVLVADSARYPELPLFEVCRKGKYLKPSACGKREGFSWGIGSGENEFPSLLARSGAGYTSGSRFEIETVCHRGGFLVPIEIGGKSYGPARKYRIVCRNLVVRDRSVEGIYAVCDTLDGSFGILCLRHPRES